MTAADFAGLTNARRCGKGKWVAKCPAHADRIPSLSITEGRKHPVVFTCRSQGCSREDILAAMGISWGDVLGGGIITPEIRQKLRDQEYLKTLKNRWISLVILTVADSDNRHHWTREAHRIDSEILLLERKMATTPQREIKMKAAIQRHGWDVIWEKFLLTEKGQAEAAQWGTR